MDIPRVALLSIGDEILFGKTLDTNAHWLAGECSQRGLRVVGQEAVGDDQPTMVAALGRACERAGLVLVSGGLGPTEDDRTRHALAELLGVELVESEAAWTEIQGYITSRFQNRIPLANRRQALLPLGADYLPNDRGTAPGILARCGDCVVACFPGVPHEMRGMALRLLDRLHELLPVWSSPAVDELHLAGIGESSVQDMLGDLLLGDEALTVGITAQKDMHLCVRSLGPQTRVAERMARIRETMAEHLLPAGCPFIADAVVLCCRERGLTLTCAESCTCGNILAQLGAVPGVSHVLREGLITYHNDAKIERLGIDPMLIEQHGVVSQEVVEAMARGAQRLAGADLAIVSSGIAGPDGGSDEKPVGTVWVAAALGDRVLSNKRVFPGTREDIQQRAASWAMLQAWQLLRDQQ